MNYEAKLKAGKAVDIATLAAHGVHLPASVDAVVLCNAARAVAALALQRDELAESLDYVIRQLQMRQPPDVRSGSGYHIARARLARHPKYKE